MCQALCYVMKLKNEVFYWDALLWGSRQIILSRGGGVCVQREHKGTASRGLVRMISP